MSDPDRAIAKAWMARAEDDLRAATNSLDAEPAMAWLACFHSEQAIEKFLKALLVQAGRTPPLTHDLETLLDLCMTVHPELERIRQDVVPLSAYAVSPRYPDLERDYSVEEAREAVERAGRALAVMRPAIGPP